MFLQIINKHVSKNGHLHKHKLPEGSWDESPTLSLRISNESQHHEAPWVGVVRSLRPELRRAGWATPSAARTCDAFPASCVQGLYGFIYNIYNPPNSLIDQFILQEQTHVSN